MKLRIRGNSLRLRLTRSEVAQLHERGDVLQRSEFAPNEILTYQIRSAPGADAVQTRFRSGSIEVLLAPERIRHWATSEDVGIYELCGPMEVAIEKDFRCLTRPEERWDEDVYPNPEESRAGGVPQAR